MKWMEEGLKMLEFDFMRRTLMVGFLFIHDDSDDWYNNGK